MVRRAAVFVPALALCACGRLGFSQLAGDGGDLDGGGSDAVSPLAPFGNAAVISEIDDIADQDDACPTADELEIYFASYRSGGLGLSDIWRATRSSIAAPWSAPENVPELSSPMAETGLRISGDGLTIMFGSDRDTGGLDVYVATRATRRSPWSVPAPVPELSTVGADITPYLLTGGTTVYLVQDDNIDGHIMRATRASAADAWNAPTVVPGLDTALYEGSPFVTDDETVIYFSSNRDGDGDFDLYVAIRADSTTTFGIPVQLGGVSSADRDDDPWLSPDGRTLYFSRTDGTGNQHIYRATR